MARVIGEARIVVFAKAPRAGAVKTRLIPRLGADGAANLHAFLVKRTLATARAAAIGRVDLYCAPDAEDDFFRSCGERYGARLENQSDGNLGRRMLNAFERTLRSAPHAILIGTDCPVLTTEHLRQADRKLAAAVDAVFSPTEDGGYTLIGLKRCNRNVFDGIAWGTSRVMAETRNRLNAAGWKWEELEQLWDVDRPEDYQRLLDSGLLNHEACRSGTTSCRRNSS